MVKFYKLAALVAIGCIGFAQANPEVGAAEIANVFERLNKAQDPTKAKINHAKGFCATGSFTPSAQAREELNIPLFDNKKINALFRYSLGGGNPKASDKDKTRGLGLELSAKDSKWVLALLNSPINFAHTPSDFINFLEVRIPKNGKVDVNAINEYTKTNKSANRHASYMSNIGVSKSVANTPYYGIHAFLINTKEGLKPARMLFIPADGEISLSKEELKSLEDNFLYDDFKKRLKKGAIKYYLYFELANKDDVLDDTSMPWSGFHKKIFVGVLEANKDAKTSCNKDVFLPGILPSGIEPPKDPLFALRDQVYTIFFSKRTH